MSENDRHREAPPPEAYSRVSNPGRFLPLHNVALALVDRLSADYDIARTDTFKLLPGMKSIEHARTPVTLTPLAPKPRRLQSRSQHFLVLSSATDGGSRSHSPPARVMPAPRPPQGRGNGSRPYSPTWSQATSVRNSRFR